MGPLSCCLRNKWNRVPMALPVYHTGKNSGRTEYQCEPTTSIGRSQNVQPMRVVGAYRELRYGELPLLTSKPSLLTPPSQLTRRRHTETIGLFPFGNEHRRCGLRVSLQLPMRLVPKTALQTQEVRDPESDVGLGGYSLAHSSEARLSNPIQVTRLRLEAKQLSPNRLASKW